MIDCFAGSIDPTGAIDAARVLAHFVQASFVERACLIGSAARGTATGFANVTQSTRGIGLTVVTGDGVTADEWISVILCQAFAVRTVKEGCALGVASAGIHQRTGIHAVTIDAGI